MKNAQSLPHQPPTEIATIDALEQAMNCRENIFAIALMLEDGGEHAAGDEQERTILSGTGRLIASETRKLKILLDILDRQFSKPKRPPLKKSEK